MLSTPAGGVPADSTRLTIDRDSLIAADVRRAQRRVAFDDSPIGIFCTDSDGAIVDAIPKCLLMLDYEWSQLVGLVAMIADLSEQRAAVRAQDDKDALVERVMSSAPMLLFAFDLHGLLTHWEGRG